MSILPRNVVDKLPSTLAPNGYPSLNPPPLPLRPSSIAAYSSYSYYPEPVRQPHPMSSYQQVQQPPAVPQSQSQPAPPAPTAQSAAVAAPPPPRQAQAAPASSHHVLHQPQAQSHPPQRATQKPRSASAAPLQEQQQAAQDPVPPRAASAARARASGGAKMAVVDGPPAMLEEAGDNEAYCYCRDVSFGQMIACDDDSCPMEWVRHSYNRLFLVYQCFRLGLLILSSFILFFLIQYYCCLGS